MRAMITAEHHQQSGAGRTDILSTIVPSLSGEKGKSNRELPDWKGCEPSSGHLPNSMFSYGTTDLLTQSGN